MFASLQWQAGLRAHERMSVMLANHLPTSMTQWLFDSPSLVYRCGGSAGFGSVKRLKHAPASRFTRRRLWSKPKTPAKHLTTSDAMLAGVKVISKLRSISLSIPTHKEFYIERLLN
jgi:hypothetical protein